MEMIKIAVFGIAAVLAAVILIWLIAKIASALKHKKTDGQPADNAGGAAAAFTPAYTGTEDESELVAVITAAIAASMGVAAERLHIRKIRRF